MGVKTYWNVNSKLLGYGPWWSSRHEAEREREELLDEDPDDVITIGEIEMDEKEYEQLPEFQGW